VNKKFWSAILSICFGVWSLSTFILPNGMAETNSEATAFQVIGRYKIPIGWVIGDWYGNQQVVFNNDGTKLAYTLKNVNISYRETSLECITSTSSQAVVKINDEQVSPVYFDIKNINLSTDGNDLGYLYSNIKDNREVFGLNFNGRDLLSDSAGYPSCIFNKDGKEMIYWLKDDTGWYIMVNNQRAESLPVWLVEELKVRPKPFGGTFNGVMPGRIIVVNKPGSKEFIYEISYYYSALLQVRTYFIKNGQKIWTNYKNISSIMTSPDGNNIACIFRDKLKEYIVLNEQVISPGFLKIGNYQFSPDGNKLLYSGMNWKTAIMMNDQKISPDFDLIDSLSQIADDSRLTYIAKKSGKYFLMVNEQIASPKFDKITSYIWNRDGLKVAYTASQKGNSFIMVNDKKATPDYPKGQQVDLISLNPEDSKVCYKVSLAGKQPKAWLISGDQPITPQFTWIKYKLSSDGRIFFAGMDSQTQEIVHGITKPW
jgi:hypothetical protein